MSYFSGDDGVFTDGLTQSVGIFEKPKVHGAIRFSFRPMLPEFVEEMEAKRERTSGKGAGAATETVVGMAKAIADHLTSWSTDRPITVDNVRKLRYGLLGRMYLIIAGLAASDEILDSEGNLIENTTERVLEASDILGKSQSATD